MGGGKPAPCDTRARDESRRITLGRMDKKAAPAVRLSRQTRVERVGVGPSFIKTMEGER